MAKISCARSASDAAQANSRHGITGCINSERRDTVLANGYSSWPCPALRIGRDSRQGWIISRDTVSGPMIQASVLASAFPENLNSLSGPML
ncbi:hypothetical protein [Bosea sp. 2RAB26]|uniref:hypothetical protein n=1 Tax=Bosea sp. 2RAB26 TaxID=3237476 RepID=UPI003F932615